MEIKNLSPVKGLQTIRKANFLAIIAVVMAAVSGIIIALFPHEGADLEQLKIDNNITVLAIIAAGVLLVMVSMIFLLISRVREIIGLIRLSKIHAGYKTALLLIIASLVLSLIFFILPIDKSVMSAVTQALNLLCVASVYFIIGATVEFLRTQDNEELAVKGLRVRTLYVSCNVVAVAAGILALLPALVLVSGLVSLVTSLIQFVALFKYIGFLGRASSALER